MPAATAKEQMVAKAIEAIKTTLIPGSDTVRVKHVVSRELIERMGHAVVEELLK